MRVLLVVAFTAAGLCVSCASTQSIPDTQPLSSEASVPAKVSFADIFDLFSDVEGSDGVKFGELKQEDRERAVAGEFAKEIVSQGVSKEQVKSCYGRSVGSSLVDPIPSKIWIAAFFIAPRSEPKPFQPSDVFKNYKSDLAITCQNILQNAMDSLNQKYSLVPSLDNNKSVEGAR